MKNRLKSKEYLLLLVGCLLPMVSQAQAVEDTPRIVLFFGRFHPLVLHLPIGALVVAFGLDLYGRIKKDYPEKVLRLIFAFAAVCSILTALFGYFLSLEGGYGATTLDLHFYTGLLTALLSVVLYRMSRGVQYYFTPFFLPVFIVTLVSLTVTGHYGSVLTHGENFLTEYAKAPAKERTITQVDSLRWYKDVVYKILDDKCIQCHNQTKTKGELSLVSAETLLQGGESGDVVIAGKSQESILYKHLLLPITHDDHMPPEGKPQLTSEEIQVIQAWIDSGMDFKGYVQPLANEDPLKSLLTNYLVFEQVRIPKASEASIKKVVAAGFRVRPIVPGSSELSVKFIAKEITKAKVNALRALDEQIIELDFSGAELTDNMTGNFNQFTHLKMLRLDKTNITDISLRNLKKLSRLEVLNLYQTAVTDQGLTRLLAAIQPRDIYTWKSKVSKQVAMALAAEHEVRIYHGLQAGFVEKSQLDQPTVVPVQTLFVDELRLQLESKFKDVELRYTFDGSEPDSTSTLYTTPLVITTSKNLKVRAFKPGWLPSEVTSTSYAKIKYKVEAYSIVNKPEQRYPGSDKLFDLKEGSLSFKDGNWAGFLGDDLNTTIDLGAPKEVDHLSVNYLKAVGDWIFPPTKVTVFAAKDASSPLVEVGAIDLGKSDQLRAVKKHKVTLDITGTTAQIFKIIVKNPKSLPSWHEGAGQDAWIFIDEIYLW